MIDHVHPFSKGGKTQLDNLQTLCQPCNAGKAGRLPTSHDMREPAPFQDDTVPHPDGAPMNTCLPCWEALVLYRAVHDERADGSTLATYRCQHGRTWQARWDDSIGRVSADVAAEIVRDHSDSLATC